MPQPLLPTASTKADPWMGFNSKFTDPALGWRLAFLIGTTIGFFILVMRRWIPESPRWLMTHGFVKEADAVVRATNAAS